jgi:hypothetical protein
MVGVWSLKGKFADCYFLGAEGRSPFVADDKCAISYGEANGTIGHFQLTGDSQN